MLFAGLLAFFAGMFKISPQSFILYYFRGEFEKSALQSKNSRKFQHKKEYLMGMSTLKRLKNEVIIVKFVSL